MDYEDWAIFDHIGERTVRLLDFTDKSKGGTGVKVQLNGRYFIATAAHVIPPTHDIRVLIKGQADSFVTTVISRGRDAETDLGFLEIGEDDARALGGSFVQGDEIVVEFPLEEEWSVVVYGYPGQMIGVTERPISGGLVRQYDFRRMSYFSGTVRRSLWPTQVGERELQEDVDLFVKFCAGAELEEVDFTSTPPKLKTPNLDAFEPAGMSGGGIWSDSRPVGEAIWSPTPKLLAIQSSMHKKQGWLRGARLSPWAELIEN